MLHHPKIEAARALLSAPPSLPLPDLLAGLPLSGVPAADAERLAAGRAALRRMASEAAETLIDLLDELDADPDLEPNDGGDDFSYVVLRNYDDDSEPSLGWTMQTRQETAKWFGDTEDREDEHDGREPSLGSPEYHPSAYGGAVYSSVGTQTGWSAGNQDDGEGDEHDGREEDDPPEESDNGIGDRGGLEEVQRDDAMLRMTLPYREETRQARQDARAAVEQLTGRPVPKLGPLARERTVFWQDGRIYRFHRSR